MTPTEDRAAPVPRRALRLGLRREATILLPVSSLVLVALSLFTLVAYRSALEQLTESERERSLALTLEIASELRERESADVALLRRLRRPSAGIGSIAVLDGSGDILASVGDAGELLRPLALPREQGRSRILGPDRPTGDAVVVLLRWQPDRILRVDFPQPLLGPQRRSWPLLAAVVIGVDAAVVILFLVFLRHWLDPFESLLERARQLGGESPIEPDEVRFLVDTFDRALHTLAREPESEEAEIEALQRTLAGTLEGGVLLLDARGRALALNEAGAELLQVPIPEPGMPLEQALAPHPPLIELLRETLDEGAARIRQECELDFDGAVRTLGLNAHPLRRGDGEVRGWLVLFGDATRLNRHLRERQLSENLGRLGELTAGVAHEMRNSLATLRGYLTLLERADEPESAREYLIEVRREADQLQRVLQDFLAFARPGRVRSEPLDLEGLVLRAGDDPVLREQGAQVEVHAPPSRPWVRGDASLLERALRNLLHNAARAQQEAGCTERPIEVAIEVEEGRIRLRVLDHGPGLDPALEQELFVPFVSGRPDGVGLGLALSHRIVELHGGVLRLANRPEGGAVAEIELPAGTIATDGN